MPSLPLCVLSPLQDPVRHKEVDALLGPVPDEKFGQLVQLGKLITDYAPADEVGCWGYGTRKTGGGDGGSGWPPGWLEDARLLSVGCGNGRSCGLLL